MSIYNLVDNLIIEMIEIESTLYDHYTYTLHGWCYEAI